MKKKAVDFEAPEKIIGRQKEQELLRELRLEIRTDIRKNKT